jgi:flagellar protein FliO/FliZ
MIEVTLRLVFSLAVVLFLMWGLARLVRRPLGGRGGPLGVLARQALSRNASVAVVRVDDRALVLGVTDTHVTLLSEADLEAFEPADDAVLPPRAARHAAPDEHGPLAGSVLSPTTWTQTLEFFRDRTSRDK